MLILVGFLENSADMKIQKIDVLQQFCNTRLVLYKKIKVEQTSSLCIHD